MSERTHLFPKQLNAFPTILCAVSTRLGGVSPEPLGMNLSYNVGDDPVNVDANRARFFGSLEISLDRLAIPRQVHSSTVRRADAPGAYDATDGLLTDRRNLWLVVSVADCTPVFVFDKQQNVVAAFHAGWRGSAAGIVGRGVETMKAEYNSHPSDLFAFIGPSAGSCCYEVGAEVAEQFDGNIVLKRNGSLYVDLKKESRRQLLEGEIPENQIETSKYCTICGDKLFHSHRRERERSGRMMGVIGLKG